MRNMWNILIILQIISARGRDIFNPQYFSGSRINRSEDF